MPRTRADSAPATAVVAVAVISVVVALVAGACSAKGDEQGGTGESEESEPVGSQQPTTDAAAGSFGDLEAVCGEGDLTVEPDQAAGSPDTLRIGVANDRSSQIRPGLNKEIWDTSQAFAAWCNDQGGIGGLPIEIVDLDARLLEVETVMTKACKGVFMMVGGGFVQDNLEFSGKPNSDFHRCGLADIPAITVSPEKSESNGQVQPLPHPATKISNSWLQGYIALEPDNAASIAEVWGNLPSMQAIKNMALATIASQDVDLVGVFDYPATGLADWTPLAQEIIGSGARSFHFVGEPNYIGTLVKTLREQGWDGNPVLETNAYDQLFIDTAGAENAKGTVIRTSFHPFEEADRWPATRQYIDIVNEEVQDAKIAFLGLQSWSAWLLFATAAKDCAASNDNVLSRDCVLEAAAAIDDWTAGGLHASSDPGPEGGVPGACEMSLTVSSAGHFERLSPEIDSEDDDGGGFECFEDNLVDVPENAGLGVVDPDRPI